MKGGNVVNKKIIIKGILLLIILAVLSMGFTGCGVVIATTGTVYIYVTGTYYYDIYVDNLGYFWGVVPGTYILYNVPIGNHFFEAIHVWGSWWGYDGYTKYITAGNNYVYLYP